MSIKTAGVGVVIFLVAAAGVFCAYFLSQNAAQPLASNCSNGTAAHTSFAESDISSLRTLAEYEAVCHGAVTHTLMVFAAMPTTQSEAQYSARMMAATLKKFAAKNIEPLVVFEPSMARPNVLSEIKHGVYDATLKTYYDTLKTERITSALMGTWVLFPEANTPSWHTTHPDDFVVNVRKVGQMQKRVFPASKVSILLSGRTYPDDDSAWNHGELKSLVPYVTGLPKGLVDSIGYQGFPSASAANAPIPYSQLDARDFLPATIIIEAMKKLAIKNVWLNTGTFTRMYTDDPVAEIRLTASQRDMILQGVLMQAQLLKARHFHVSVNLFAADKSQSDEHTDWSYWQPGKATASADTTVFDMFVRRLRQNEIGFMLYA